MRQNVKSAVDQIKAATDKEDEVLAWFSIGAELQRIGRHFKSAKIFGQQVQNTEMRDLPPSDRSDARWMFQNWKTVLEWIEAKSGDVTNDPFRDLADLNHSHPSAIRRQIRDWLKNSTDPSGINQDLAIATQVAFETAWRRSSTDVELSQPSINFKEGIDYVIENYDPFCGNTSARYSFSWAEITEFIKDPSDNDGLVDRVSDWIGFDGESNGAAELVMDTEGRVHARSDIED